MKAAIRTVTEMETPQQISMQSLPVFYFFSFPQEHSSSAFITLSLRLGGGKDNGYHQPLSHFQYCITIMNMVHNIQYHQRKKDIEKMYPSECGRALKYVTCKGKNWCSIIPKRDAEKFTSLAAVWLFMGPGDHSKLEASLMVATQEWGGLPLIRQNSYLPEVI